MPELPDDLRGVDALLRTMAPADPAPPALRARTLAAVAAAGAGTPARPARRAGGSPGRPGSPPRRPRSSRPWCWRSRPAGRASSSCAPRCTRPGRRARPRPPTSGCSASGARSRSAAPRSRSSPRASSTSCGSRRRATARGRLDRISAGTFHPDPEGVSDVRLTAAVDPAKYPILIVTAESRRRRPAPEPERRPALRRLSTLRPWSPASSRADPGRPTRWRRAGARTATSPRPTWPRRRTRRSPRCTTAARRRTTAGPPGSPATRRERTG